MKSGSVVYDLFLPHASPVGNLESRGVKAPALLDEGLGV